MSKLRFCFDDQCFELAEYFLPDGLTEDQCKLAQTIQEAIEDWLREYEAAQQQKAEKS